METNKSTAMVEISIVIPVLNESGSLIELYRSLTHVLSSHHYSYEILFVDDGSSDGSISICRDLAEVDSHVQLIELRRNFGKATALQTGFHIAQGEIIITMDGDLQDDPEEIPRFIEMINRDYDLVSGWKQNRQDPLTKTLPSRFFNTITGWVTGLSLRDFNCGFKAYRREVAKSLNLYGELHRYIPVLAHAKGYRIGEIPVHHHPRLYGKSKYSIERFLRGAFDLATVTFLIGYQRRPLHLFGLIGLVVSLLGLSINTYLTVLWFIGDRPIGDRPLLTLGTMLILLGVQILVFGLLAEMITAATYKRAETLRLVRRVHRSGIVDTPDDPDDIDSPPPTWATEVTTREKVPFPVE